MKAVLSLLLTALLFSVVASLPGSKLCAQGPGYWCSSPEAARQCGATAHCVELWRNSDLEAVGGDASEGCSVCQMVSADLHRLAKTGRTLAQMQAAALGACGLVPEAAAAQACRRLAAAESGLVELLAAGLQPAKACVLTRQCRGRRSPDKETSPAASLKDLLLTRGAPLSAWKSRYPNSDLCNGCVQVLTAIKTSLGSNNTQAEIANALKTSVCPQLGPLAQLCDQFADQYLGIVLSQLSQDIQPQQICTLFDFCNTTTSSMAKYRRHPVLQLMKLQRTASTGKPAAPIQCELCEALVNEARQMLRDGRTQAEIEKFVEDTVCSLVPAEKEQCIKNVKEYGPIIFQLLVSQLDPKTVCQALGACGASGLSGAKAAPQIRASPQCLLCEFVMREIDQLLGQNSTQAEIEAALEQVCNILPQTVRQECDSFVQQYTPIIIQLLVNGLGPKTVCTTLGLCSQSHGPIRVRPVATAVNESPRASSTACDVCQTVIQYAKALLKENATEKEIVQILEKVCSFLPSAEQAACRSFVEQYGPYVIELLLQDANPKQICQMLGLCSSGITRAPKQHKMLRYRLHSNKKPLSETLRFSANRRPSRRFPMVANGLVQMVHNAEEPLVV